MRRILFPNLLSVIFLSLPVVSFAGVNSYQCQIKEFLFVQKDGSLKRPPDPIWIGKRFSIERNTGKLVGPETALWSFIDSTSVILAKGNGSNSFVVVIHSPSLGDGVHSTTINIQEYQDGKIKPFSVLSSGEVASGLCE